jgi:glycosyltransferase involved in cell wall biosynthesis
MKFSIIIPTYNRAYLIDRALKSLVNQTYLNFEAIIVDDGSIDQTKGVVDVFLEDVRFKYFKLEKNSGVNVARNFGLTKIASNSEWITFLDSDDEFTTNALENIKGTIERIKSVNYFRFAVCYADGRTACNLDLSGSILNYSAYIENHDKCGEWVVVLKREIITSGFQYESRINGYESVAYMRLSKQENVYFDKAIVRKYHVANEGLSRKLIINKNHFKNKLHAFQIILNEFGQDVKLYNYKMYVNYLYEVSILYFILNNYPQGFNKALMAIRQNPFHLGILRIIKNVILIRT